MRRVIIIGTLHLGLTPKNELETILEELAPTQLLVELAKETPISASVTGQADEMRFAVNWAITKNIPVNFFDVNIGGILQNGCDEDDAQYQKLIKEQVAELQAFSWKELNKRSLWEQGKLGEIEKQLHLNYIDSNKWKFREQAMLTNVKKMIKSEGVIVILTGIGHLNFFEENLADAELLLRN